MELYLMRHGTAVSPYSWGESDSTRPLSSDGKKELKNALKYMVKAGFKPASILTSPFRRTVETAELVQSAVGPCPLIKAPLLASGARARVMREAIINSGAPAPLLVVGHHPDLGVFAAQMTGYLRFMDGEEFSTGEMAAFDTGAFENDWGTGKVLWRRQLSDWAELKIPS